MIDDGRFLLVEFDAALAAQIAQNVADVAVRRDENVAAAVDEARDGVRVDVAAEFCEKDWVSKTGFLARDLTCYGRRKDDQMIVQKLSVLDKRKIRIIGKFVREMKAIACKQREKLGGGDEKSSNIAPLR